MELVNHRGELPLMVVVTEGMREEMEVMMPRNERETVKRRRWDNKDEGVLCKEKKGKRQRLRRKWYQRGRRKD